MNNDANSKFIITKRMCVASCNNCHMNWPQHLVMKSKSGSVKSNNRLLFTWKYSSEWYDKFIFYPELWENVGNLLSDSFCSFRKNWIQDWNIESSSLAIFYPVFIYFSDNIIVTRLQLIYYFLSFKYFATILGIKYSLKLSCLFTYQSTRSQQIWANFAGVGNKWIFAKQVNNNEIRAKNKNEYIDSSDSVSLGKQIKKTDTNEKDRCWTQQRQNVWQHSECCCVTNATIICIISHILIHLCSVILSPLVRFFPWFYPQHHNTYTIE